MAYQFHFIVFAALIGRADASTELNGLDLAGAIVPAEEIFRGGPGRDGIPALDAPGFADATSDRAPGAEERVLGLTHGGVPKAYPIALQTWHEIVNDVVGSEPAATTYCPLCGSSTAVLAHDGAKRLRFGVSGLLYNSDVLYYDRETETLWSQIPSLAIAGPLRGTRLTSLPIENTTWAEWRDRHPGTVVPTTETGVLQTYRIDPYVDYARSDQVMFAPPFRAAGYHPKERVIGVELSGTHKAYAFVELGRASARVHDRVADRDIVITFDDRLRSAAARDRDGTQLISTTAYWFAWYAFHPQTLVYKDAQHDR